MNYKIFSDFGARLMWRRSVPDARVESTAVVGVGGRAVETNGAMGNTNGASAFSRDKASVSPNKKRPSPPNNEWHKHDPSFRVARKLISALRVQTPERARDVLTAAVLCECVGRGPADADVRSALDRLTNEFPDCVISTDSMSVAHDRVKHRYLVADSPGAIYVACAGTRNNQDLMTDVSVLRISLALDAQSEILAGQKIKNKLAAHAGFATRARGLRKPISVLLKKAINSGKRLVLCGHSLGGAVAALSLITLLLDVDDGGFGDLFGEFNFLMRDQIAEKLVASGSVVCIGYAAPPSVDEATRLFITSKGWHHAFMNIVSPEDYVPKLMLDSRKNFTKEKRIAASDVDDRSIKKPNRWRVSYVHVGQIHVLFRDGMVDVVSGGSLLNTPESNSGSSGLFTGFAGFTVAQKKVRDALAEHTMRAYRVRLLRTVSHKIEESSGRSGVGFHIFKNLQWVPFVRFLYGTRVGSSDAKLIETSENIPRATAIEPQPKPTNAIGTVSVEESGHKSSASTSKVSLLVTITGNDLDLTTSIGAECNGWPCGAIVEGNNINSRITQGSGVKGVTEQLLIRVYPPTWHGSPLSDHLFPHGGNENVSWRNTFLFLKGDFGDAGLKVELESNTPRQIESRL